ncbi:MAG: FecR domain-containing protein [Ferruginibacter sp.]
MLEKLNSGTASAEEIEQINQWYHSFDDTAVELTAAPGDSATSTAAAIKARLDKTLQLNKAVKPLPSYAWWRLPAAAALLVLAGLAVYFKFFNHGSAAAPVTAAHVAVPVIQQLKPGENKAILTLANNSQVILDSAANGVISTQGNIQVEKMHNGQLVYSINGRRLDENDAAFYNTITTPRGGQYQVTLADGTGVWLNAQSSVRFPVVFTGKQRQVEITGEAYFEVAKDVSRPFIVKTPASAVEVLGTHFNVNAYDDELSVKTTLVEGKVKVNSSIKNQSEFLLPGQQSAIAKNGDITVNLHADTDEALAWKNGRFQFKSADLKSILRQLQRWYDAEVEYRGNVAGIRFTGQLPRSGEVTKLFEKIELTGEVKFRIDGKKIIVSH